MKQVLIRKGSAVVQETPAPVCGRGEVLVQTAYSLISTGTETSTLLASIPPPAAGVWARRARHAGEIVRMAATRGWTDTVAAVEARLEGESLETGYSLAGVVVEVGSAVTDLVPGQWVACGGASCANHAEVVAVPRNLVVVIPKGLPPEQAAFVTLGAIALQGVRQADLRLGEIACVVGLGLVGQLSVAMLKASGCRVFGVDVSSSRVERGGSMGLDLGLVVGRDDVEAAVERATGAHGVDAALVTAASPSSEPIRQAARLVRHRGRVVVVGAVGMDLDRAELYRKEVDVRVSCSYGPGRYDPRYEEDGADYPYGLVRWTENRNMQEFLRLAALGSLRLDSLVDRIVPLSSAGEAYQLLLEDNLAERPLAIVLKYPFAETPTPTPARRTVEVVPRTRQDRALQVALVGPGSFAAEVLLPNLAALAPDAALRSVVGRGGNAAREIARRWGASVATTDLGEVLRDPEVDVLLVSTRHDLHAEQAALGLAAGKGVFLEKPASLDFGGLDRLGEALERSGKPLIVDFNRRFAPDILLLRSLLEKRSGPLVVSYRVNAGRLPQEHWVHGAHGGGRLIGEACHMVDLLDHLVAARRTTHALVVLPPPPGRSDLPLGDNFSLTSRYDDGSVTTLIYTALGHAKSGKERIEAYWDGKSAVIEDFRGLVTVGTGETDITRDAPDKGHREILKRFLAHARGDAPAPIPPREILDVSRFLLELDREARGGATKG